MKSIPLILFFTACFALSLVAGTLAQDTEKNEQYPLLAQGPAKSGVSNQLLSHSSQEFWEHLDLLNSKPDADRPEVNSWIRTYSLYAQSFSAAKPEAQQTAPARSYFLSISDRGKDNAYVGLANIASEDKLELKNMYQRNLDTELLVGYQWGRFGSILFGRALQLEREGDSFGRLTDMGWRIKFMKTF